MARNKDRKYEDSRVARWLTILTALGLAAALSALALMGPPPAIRSDGLWVHGHLNEARAFGIGLGVAGGASLLILLLRRGWAAVAGLWTLAVVATALWFWDQAVILCQVVVDHTW